jgi:hypothetical protein
MSRPCRIVRGLEESLSERRSRGMAGRGMACVNQTQPHCVNQMGNIQSIPLAARHGRGTSWERHGMCKLAFFLFPCQHQHFLLIFVIVLIVP